MPSRREAVEESKEKAVEEAKAWREAVAALQSRVETSTTLAEAARNYQTDPKYAFERHALYSINNLGLMEGVIAGLATFFVLRRVPKIVMRILERQEQRTRQTGAGGGGLFSSWSSPYRLDARPTSNPFHKAEHQEGEPGGFGMFVLKTFKFGLDLSVSLLVAASTSFQYTEERIMVEKAANIPLVAGRSIVSDEFCSVIHKELSKRDRRFWEQAESPFLRSLAGFGENCRKRRALEQSIRQEEGLPHNAPVSIPPPGVPIDYIVVNGSDDDENGITDYSDDNDVDGMYFAESTETKFGSDTYFGKEDDAWSDSMVTDQEEGGDRKGRGNNEKNWPR